MYALQMITDSEQCTHDMFFYSTITEGWSAQWTTWIRTKTWILAHGVGTVWILPLKHQWGDLFHHLQLLDQSRESMGDTKFNLKRKRSSQRHVITTHQCLIFLWIILRHARMQSPSHTITQPTIAPLTRLTCAVQPVDRFWRFWQKRHANAIENCWTWGVRNPIKRFNK